MYIRVTSGAHTSLVATQYENATEIKSKRLDQMNICIICYQLYFFLNIDEKNVRERHKKKKIELRDSVYHSVLYTKTLI